jgi:LmbE family N-acetylglucosaminyl deacetylase
MDMKQKKVLVVAPHPDDETLGCGGTLLKHKANGDGIYWLIITNIDEKNGWQKKRVESRQQEIDKVSEMYGFSKIFKLNFPTTKLDTIPISDIIGKISNVINKIQPSVIYINNYSDVHTDHQITFSSVMSCTKTFNYPYIKRILMYETISETEYSSPGSKCNFDPNVFIDISKYFAKKCEIIKNYKSELMDFPLPRSFSSIESLARLRGSRIGVEYAEAFVLLQDIID